MHFRLKHGSKTTRSLNAALQGQTHSLHRAQCAEATLGRVPKSLPGPRTNDLLLQDRNLTLHNLEVGQFELSRSGE